MGILVCWSYPASHSLIRKPEYLTKKVASWTQYYRVYTHQTYFGNENDLLNEGMRAFAAIKASNPGAELEDIRLSPDEGICRVTDTGRNIGY